jgi:hypothetical protein
MYEKLVETLRVTAMRSNKNNQAAEAIEQLERQLAERDAEIAKYRDASLLKEVHLINDTYKRTRSERVFAIDDIEYDLFSAGWKAAVDLIVKPGEQ